MIRKTGYRPRPRPTQRVRRGNRAQNKRRLSQLEVFRAGLAPHLVGLQFKRDLLAFGEAGKPGTLDRRDMNEHILTAVGGGDEAKALLTVEPLHSTCRHLLFSKRIRT